MQLHLRFLKCYWILITLRTSQDIYIPSKSKQLEQDQHQDQKKDMQQSSLNSTSLTFQSRFQFLTFFFLFFLMIPLH